MLRDGQRDARNVRLLKRVRADQLASHLPRNAHDRRGIEHGRGNAGHHVRGARTGRGDRHTNAPGSARVAIGHVRRALLVADEYVMDIAVLQRVIGGQNRAAGIAEYGGNALLFQTFPENLRACFDHKSIRPDSEIAQAGPSLGPTCNSIGNYYTGELK